MKKRLCSVVLVFALLLTMLPTTAFAVETRAGTQITVGNADGDFVSAVKKANNGDTLIIDKAFINDTGSDDAPVIIDKAITIKAAEGKTASINIRAGGIVLGADVTLENIALNVTNAVRPAIFVNGHSLTATNISKVSGTQDVSIFAGAPAGIRNLPQAGTSASITVNNSTFRAVYAGGMGQAFGGNVSITLHNSTVETVSDGGMTDNKTPNASYGTTGTVTVTLEDRFTTVDGAGANSMSVIASAEDLTGGLALKNVKDLHITSGTVGLVEQPDTLAVTLENGAKLNLADSTDKKLGSLSGSGTLIAGKKDTITIDTVEGTHIFETVGGYGGHSGEAEYDHTYIVQNGGTGEFTMNPHFTQSGMTWEKTGTDWTTKKGAAPEYSTTVESFSFVDAKKTATVTEVADDGVVLSVTYQATDESTTTLTAIPFFYEVTYEGKTYLGKFESDESSNGAFVDDIMLGLEASDGYLENPDCILISRTIGGVPKAGTYTISLMAPNSTGYMEWTTCVLHLTDSDSLDALKVTEQPIKTVYTVGDTFDPTGMKVAASYGEPEHWVDVTEYVNYTPDRALTKNDTEITINYTEDSNKVSATIPIAVLLREITQDMFVFTVPNLTSDGITDHFTAIKGAVSQKNGYTGIGTVTVVVKQDDKEVTEAKTAGKYDVYVACTEGDTYAAVLELFIGTVTVADSAPAPTLTEISVSQQPTKTAYKVGEQFDPTGMEVTASYSDTSTKVVTNYSYAPTGTLTKDDTTITVSYTEGGETKTATVAITVTEVPAPTPTLTGIRISQQPTKTAYKVGEQFDPTGMEVTASYSDTSTKVVTNYSYAPTGTLTKDDTTITVSYTEGEATQTATVTITVTEVPQSTPTPTPTPNPTPTPSFPEFPSGNTGNITNGTTGNQSDTVKNPDGSTTKTETKKDGTTVETTTKKDGTVSKTETKKDGTISKTETKPDGSSVVENTLANGSVGTVETDANGNVSASASISRDAVKDAKKNDAPVTVPVRVTAQKEHDDVPTVSISVPKTAKTVKVEIPVTNVTASTVVVLVHKDGTEQIVKETLPTENGVQITISGDVQIKVVDNAKSFDDTTDHWSREEVDFVTSRELFNGIGEDTFGVEQSMSREMVNTVLARLAGVDTNGGASWQDKGNTWAIANGICDGTNLSDEVTREQLVTMLYRYAGTPAVDGTLAAFQDTEQVSDYANDAMCWAVENGLIQGVGDDCLAPKSSAKRSQVAAIFARFLRMMQG